MPTSTQRHCSSARICCDAILGIPPLVGEHWGRITAELHRIARPMPDRTIAERSRTSEAPRPLSSPELCPTRRGRLKTTRTDRDGRGTRAAAPQRVAFSRLEQCRSQHCDACYQGGRLCSGRPPDRPRGGGEVGGVAAEGRGRRSRPRPSSMRRMRARTIMGEAETAPGETPARIAKAAADGKVTGGKAQPPLEGERRQSGSRLQISGGRRRWPQSLASKPTKADRLACPSSRSTLLPHSVSERRT